MGGGAGAGNDRAPKREFDTDKVMALAAKHWAGEGRAFAKEVVMQVYNEELKPSNYALSR